MSKITDVEVALAFKRIEISKNLREFKRLQKEEHPKCSYVKRVVLRLNEEAVALQALIDQAERKDNEETVQH
tara:strand:+ start:777 stop:992 length:216 start_codon:yes stop_codon:yes gene_type:complete